VSDFDKRIQDAANLLGEHCDSVQIIAVVHNDKGDDMVVSYAAGSGSLYERIGATREWLIRQDEYTKEHARRHAFNDDDETEGGDSE
jgi:hypothetical protein